MAREFHGTIKKDDRVAYRDVSIRFINDPPQESWSGFVRVHSWEPNPPELLDRYRLILDDGREFVGYVVTQSLPVISPPIRFTLAGQPPAELA